MKASELRIGNLINYRDEGLNPNITPIFLGRDLMLQILDGRCNVDYTIEPIPLTEEWLVKFGFRKERRKWENGLGESDYFICPREWYVISFFERIESGSEFRQFRIYYWDKWHNNDKFLDCHQMANTLLYVHQLQNLYFALTGEELI